MISRAILGALAGPGRAGPVFRLDRILGEMQDRMYQTPVLNVVDLRQRWIGDRCKALTNGIRDFRPVWTKKNILKTCCDIENLYSPDNGSIKQTKTA